MSQFSYCSLYARVENPASDVIDSIAVHRSLTAGARDQCDLTFISQVSMVVVSRPISRFFIALQRV